MRSCVLLACVALAVAVARGPGHPHGPRGPGRFDTVCAKAIFPDPANKKNFSDQCITENNLQAAINAARQNQSLSGHPHHGRHHFGGGGGGGGPDLLESAGDTANALIFRRCLAQKQGFVSADGTFNVTGYQDSLRAKLPSNSTQLTNLNLGIANCSTSDLTNDFDIRDYARCILPYCDTGSAG